MGASRLMAIESFEGEGKRHYLAATVIIMIWLVIVSLIVLEMMSLYKS